MMQLTNPKFAIINKNCTCSPEYFSGGIYSACEGLSSEQIKKIIVGVFIGNNEILKLNTPIQYVFGVGPKRAKLFNKLGVYTMKDLLEYYPRDWIFQPDVIKIDEMQFGENVAVIGKIKSVDYQNYGKIPIFKIVIADDTGECKSIWFNGGYLRHQLKTGQTVMLFGKVENDR